VLSQAKNSAAWRPFIAAAGGNEGVALPMNFDPIEIADALAEIASKTQEPETARRLLALVERLLTQGGLPPVGPGSNSTP
jgi:hypothetical protein